MCICTKNFYHTLLVWLRIAWTKPNSNPTEIKSTDDSAKLNGVNFSFTLENAILSLWDSFIYFRHHVSCWLYLYCLLEDRPKTQHYFMLKGRGRNCACNTCVSLCWDKSPGWGSTIFFFPVRLYSGYRKTSHSPQEVYGRISSMGAKTHVRNVRKKSL